MKTLGELRPLSDIMEGFLEDLKSGKAAEHFRLEESAYRRGYHQGYDKAIDDIFDLLQEMDQQQAYRLIALHCNLIGSWRREKRDTFIIPPVFSKTDMLETLEHRNRPQLEEDHEDFEEEGD